MKSKVEQYAKGDFYIEYPEVQLSKSYLQLKIEAGSIYTGSISVTSLNDVAMKMMVYDDAYLLCLQDHSVIGKKGEIAFTFDGRSKKKGSIYEGSIHLIGNGLEQKIPYNIEIVAPFIDVNGVALEDLMKFSALAEENWDKALQTFCSDEFAGTLLQGNEEYLQAYRSLQDSPDKNMALEEFLVYTHKKRALTLQVEHNRFQYNFPKMKESHQLILKKNTWGYSNMKVSTDAKFISLQKNHICSMDFEGDSYSLEYTLDPEQLDENETTSGSILLENTYQQMVVNIVIRKPEEANRILVHRNHDRKLRKMEVSALIHNYLDYRVGLLPLMTFIENTRDSLQKLISFEPGVGVYKLGMVHMSILAGQEDNARQEIRRMEADMDTAMQGKKERCYALYLKALLSKDVRLIVKACQEIEKALELEKDKLFYFWLLIHLDERYQKDKQWLYTQIEGLYMGGYESPVLAIEICDLINQDPMLLKKLSAVELAAVKFGLKNHYLSKEAETEFLQLAAREKTFSKRVFSLLAMLYDVQRKPEIIQIICSLLIKGGKLDHMYHPYYLEGIKCGYKIVGIQENYLRSMDKSRYDLMPDSVLRYFNYKSTLTDNEYAYLYANVVNNKRHYLGQYDDYLPNMTAFMEGQIVKGNMSDDLSVLYSEFLTPQTVTPHFAPSIVNVIFKRKLTVMNDNIIAVVVAHKELEKEEIVPVINHVAYVDMITESAVISLVDKNKNRYVSTIPYKLQKLVDEAAYMEILGQYASDDYRYVLYQYSALRAFEATKAREVNIARDMLAFSEISVETKQQAIYGIVRYYHEQQDMEILRSYVDRVDMDYVSAKRGVEYINYLILCKLYDKAYDAVKRFGYQGVAPENLVKLVEKVIEVPQLEKDEELIAIAVYLYRMGQDSSRVLAYLVDHYQSCLQDMIKLWKRAHNKLTRLDVFEENIICETLYTEKWHGDIFKVFASYAEKKRHGMVMKAFLKRASFAYLVEEHEIPEDFFQTLYSQMVTEEWKDDMCCAALLLFLSRKAKLEEQEVTWIKEQVEAFIKRGILLPFFRGFKQYMKLPKDLFLMTYVVTRNKAGMQIAFRYGIQSGVEKPDCNKTARMMEMIPGYYVKEFVLFHGENLLYTMPDDMGNFTKVYESEGMKAKGETEEYENRFEMLNSMLVNQEIGENQILINKIDKYLKLSAIIEENLQLMD